jgi:molybdopterin-guanine dinucleotide biosynthesis protein A
VVGRRGKFFEPLAAIYPREAKWLAWETVASGDYALQHFLAAAVRQGLMRVHRISAAESALFANWNEPS